MTAFRNSRARLMGAALAALALVQAPSVLAHPAPFTIDQVMGAPYPSSLTAAPRGRGVAWVFESRGVRNIWVADADSGTKGRQVTTFTGDDGYDIGDVAWSADAKWIAFSRGQTLEDDQPANVASSPAGPIGREIWITATSGGGAHKVGSGHSASFSPDGTKLVFCDKGHLFLASATGQAADKPLITDTGAIGQIAWSPDGRRLAFVSRRRAHALVGIYDFAANTIVWASPSLDHDASPVFSPDGSKVAFIRVANEKSLDFVTRRSAQPWSIWEADSATGQGGRVWRSDEGMGSAFHQTLSQRNLFWTAHDQLVFPWEKTGWVQLYAVPARGGPARALTSGAFEVAHMTISPDRARIVYSSNQDDIDRAHVWTIDPDGGAPVRVSSDTSIESAPQTTDDGAIFALQSDGTMPLTPVILTDHQWRPLAPEAVPASFPSAKLVAPQTVTFAAKDGQLVHAQIFLPKGDASRGPHPAILFFHGGPERQMLLGFHPMDAYNWMYSENEFLAAQGYIVLSVNYRGGIGYGMEYREAKSFGPDGGSEVNDLLGAVSYLQSRPDVDAHRLGIWGASYGGLMTALGLSRASDSIAAGVDYAGLYDWSTFLASIGDPIEDPDAIKRAVASSPVGQIDKWKSPVLIVQADDDRNVPMRQASDLIEDLRSRNIPHDEIAIPNEVHDLTRYASWMLLFNATSDYFEKHLENLPASPAR